jgi:exonuclease III
MRLLSWNVNRAVAKLDAQADAVLAREPDVVALQEVTATTLGRWRERLDGYLPHTVCPLDGAPLDRVPAGPRRLAPLVASRRPLSLLAAPAVPWAETVACAKVAGEPGFDLYDLHVPNSRNGWVKVETLEAVHAHLAAHVGRSGILCGDFNTPRRETAGGEVVTFARDRYARLRPERGERWDRAERALLLGLRASGMVDVFRHLHGYERKEISWAWPRFPRSGYRLDHVIASVDLDPVRCEYLHDLRLAGLSDHSPLEVDFAAVR